MTIQVDFLQMEQTLQTSTCTKMRSKIAQRLESQVPEETKIFVAKYADIVVRINALIKEKGYTQKSLAARLGKKPSEISKWLNGEHNFTLRSLAKLEAELGETIIHVPQHRTFVSLKTKPITMTVHSNVVRNTGGFKIAEVQKVEHQGQVA